MEDNLADIIRKARVAWPSDENNGKPSYCMTESGHTPFDSSSPHRQRRGEGCNNPVDETPKVTAKWVLAFKWSEEFLRTQGSNRDRVLMAVRDAARVIERKGKNPFETEFYVTRSIAKGWNLNSRQLSEGLKDLEKLGSIVIAESCKGKHVRMTLIQNRSG